MSFLYPLYFLGLAALSIPIFLHFRHRHTRQRMPFSTLMFLSQTRIREKRHRKLQHILLLLLRCLILALVAFCFARPFLRQENPFLQMSPGEAVAVVIDRSASMRRGDVWEQAQDKAKEIVGRLDNNDSLQIYGFGSSPRLVLTFDEWERLPQTERKGAGEARIDGLTPTWETTDLVQALTTAAEAFADAAEDQGPSRDRKVVLISDFQSGDSIEALQQYPWPPNVVLECVTVRPERSNNATLRLLPASTTANLMENAPRKVRVTSDSGTQAANYTLRWNTGEGNAASRVIDVSLAAGGNRLVDAPPTNTGLPAPVLEITGDDHDYDNRWFVSVPPQRPYRILYYGDDDAASPDSSLFFLERALITTRSFQPELVQRTTSQSLEGLDLGLIDLVILADPAPSANIDLLLPYLTGGGRILFLMHSTASAPSLAKLSGVPEIAATEVEPDDYALVGRLDRQHPLLLPFADARFGDFSKMHFWRYRRIDPAQLPEAHVIAYFDSGAPLWLEMVREQGDLLVFTTGWYRRDGQLALSSKFIPLLYSLFHRNRGGLTREPLFWVGDSLPVPADKEVTVRTPGGATVQLSPGTKNFDGTTEPGLYVLELPQGAKDVIAVNLNPSESILEDIEPDALRSLLAREDETGEKAIVAGDERTAKKILTAEEQEANQKIWRIVLLLALILALGEILYSSHCHRTQKLQKA